MERKRSVKRYGSRRYKRSFGTKCKDFWRNFIAFMFSNVGIIGLVVGYTIAGAFMFQAIEGVPDEGMEDSEPSLSAARNKTVSKLWALLEDSIVPVDDDSSTWHLYAEPLLKDYTAEVVYAVQEGFDGKDDAKDLAEKWAFPGAFLYSLTVITTIGYGNVSPKKPWGKIMTIVYAIAGMPLFLLYLSNIGDILARCFKWLYAKCCLCRWCPNVARRREERRRRRMQVDDLQDNDSIGMQGRDTAVSMPMEEFDMRQLPHGHEEAVEEEEDGSDGTYDDEYDAQTVTVPVTICLAIMVGYVCGGAFLFAEYEGWNYLDGSYFCFISLSTIGFGDIVPGVNTYYSDRQGLAMSFVFCSMYLMLGMALIAMCFNLMQEEVIHKIRKVVRTVRRIFR